MFAIPLPSRSALHLLRALQLATWVTGAALLSWAFLDLRFRDGDGFPKSEMCLPLAAGVALAMLAWTLRSRYSRSAFWLALTLLGQAIGLQWIDAGPLVGYQHYKPVSHLLVETHPLLVSFVIMQAMAVTVGIKVRWPAIRAWAGRSFRAWQLVSLSAAIVLSSAAPSRDIAAYLGDLALATVLEGISLGTLALAAWSLPDNSLPSLGKRLENLLGQGNSAQATRRGGVDRLAMVLAIWVTVVAALLSLFVYERHPHLQDEVLYLYQARYFASEALTTPAPPVPEAFTIYMIPYASDRWYSPFPPGWPAMLALGIRVGFPWLVNPLLAGINLLLSFFVVQDIYDRPTARLTVLLLAVSPWSLFMAMSLMSHTFTLTAALVAAVGIIQARRNGKARWGWVAGCGIGVATLIRPMDGLIVAVVLGLWALGLAGQRLRLPALGSLALGVLLVGGLALPYNAHLTGSPTRQPLEAYYEQYFGHDTNAMGFGSGRGLGWPIDAFPGHSPLEAAINALVNVFSINVELFGWGTGSLLLVALLVFSRRMLRVDYQMLAVIAVVLGMYSLYWFSGGPDFGARYWYLMLVPLVALTARGAGSLASTMGQGAMRDHGGAVRVYVAILFLSAIALVDFLPWRAIDKYHRYLGMGPDIPRLAENYGFGKSLVLIRGEEMPDYTSAWTHNPLDLQADQPVYAWDRGREVRSMVLNAYSDRPLWIVKGPSITGRGFEVAGGPSTASEVAARDARNE